MQEEFDKVFGRVNSYFANDPLFKTAFDNSFHQPLIDISSNSDEYIIKMDIPGVKSSDIDIKAENNILTVKAELDEYKESNSTTFIRKERYANRFLRELSLSNDVDSSKMKHEYKDGVLTIMLPKK
jgi:HSP20 family protein